MEEWRSAEAYGYVNVGSQYRSASCMGMGFDARRSIRHDAGVVIEIAVHARHSSLGDIAPHFARPAGETGLRRSFSSFGRGSRLVRIHDIDVQ